VDEAGDVVREDGTEAGGEVVAHAFHEDEFGAGDSFSCSATAGDVDHGVGEAVEDECGNADLAQARGAIAGGNGGDGLPGDGGLVVVAVVGERSAGEELSFVAGPGG